MGQIEIIRRTLLLYVMRDSEPLSVDQLAERIEDLDKDQVVEAIEVAYEAARAFHRTGDGDR
jgi:hypothetical protein